MAEQERKVEQRRKMICYVVTHKDSGKRYVGITKRSLKVRKSQHERDAMRECNRGPVFHHALRECGKDAFTWEIVAEGEDQVIRFLETALIGAWDTAGLGGFNSTGLYAEAPVRDLGYEEFAEEMDAGISQLHMMNDLSSIVSYCEGQPYLSPERLQDIRELGTRLVKCVDEIMKKRYT